VYEELTFIPDWVQYVEGEQADKPRWGGKVPPPPIGTEILITINKCGPAIVTGYFVEDNFLGLLCRLTSPPEWHKKQNKGDPRGHVFGPEFRLP
jgi:hypothetical protein